MGTLAVLASLLFSTPLFAQDDPRGQGSPRERGDSHARDDRAAPDGYVAATLVTAEGDSLRGYVEQWMTNRTPQAVRFRRRAGAPAETYPASALRSVRTAERRLGSRAVQVDQVPSDPEQAARFFREGRATMAPDTLLMEVLADGPMRLYMRRDGSHEQFFVETEGRTTQLIKRRRYVASSRSIATSYRYRDQLASLMDECPEARRRAARIRFQERTLKALVLRYNRCVSGEENFFVQDDASLINVSFGVTASGIGSQAALCDRRLDADCGPLGGAPERDGSVHFDAGVGASLGFRVELRQAWGRRYFALPLALSGRVQSMHGTQVQSRPSSPSSQGTARAWFAHASLLPRLYFAPGRWQPYAEAGAFATYLVGFDAGDLRYSTTRVNRYIDAGGVFPRLQPGLAAGLGVKRQRFEVGLRFERATFFDGGDFPEIPAANVLLTAGYRL